MPSPDMVRTLLERRGLNDSLDVDKFLNPDFERDTHDPLSLLGMERAVSRLLNAIAQGERIAVYADFDCDGIPGAALLHDFFKKVQYENFVVYIPHRDREGYGFHKAAVEELARGGATLIVTVDVGTSAAETARFAREKGVDVIVTDHHDIVGAIPDAIVLNPKLGGYPFADLCGTAVAWKLVAATVNEGRRRSQPGFTSVAHGWEKWLLDLVAIATVADMVPLLGENRVLARFGLSVLRKSPRAGLRALCALVRVRQGELTEDDIGFSLAPRINAASRMDSPELAFRLLTTVRADEAESLAQELERLNASRKGVVASIVREAKRKVRARFKDSDDVVVIGDADWKPALLGLAANSVLGERSGIVCLWGRDANGAIKGSCRSDGSISVTELFSRARAALSEYGGHRASGGFSASYEQVHHLDEAFASAARALPRNPTEEINGAELLVPLSDVSWRLFEELSRLAPFGVGNPKPVLRIAGARVSAMRRFGKAQEHVEVSLECSATGRTMRCFQFFMAPERFSVSPIPGHAVAALATIERDTYRGDRALALRVTDLLPA